MPVWSCRLVFTKTCAVILLFALVRMVTDLPFGNAKRLVRLVANDNTSFVYRFNGIVLSSSEAENFNGNRLGKEFLRDKMSMGI